MMTLLPIAVDLPDPVAEAAARIWLDLRGAGLRSFVVTGCRGGEGATTFTEALGRAANHLDGKRVLLIDANTLSADLTLLRLRADPAAQATEIAPFAHRTALAPGIDLAVGRAGPGRHLPPERELAVLRDQALQSHDLVIWDSAGISQSLDTRRLIGVVGSVVLVTQSDVTRIDQLSTAVNEVAALSARTIAVIRNRSGRNPLSISAVQH